MNLNDLITELLFSHDCVVIPGIGGFLLDYSPATIHPVQHLFLPPSRTVVFNSGLDNNDGLLANSCVLKYGVTYDDAMQKIGVFAENIRQSLHSDGRYSFGGIGRLIRSGDHRISFEPEKGVNFLDDAFGLPAFTSPAIDRGAYHAVIQPERVDRKPSRAKTSVPVSLRWVFMAIPVLIVAVWFLVLPDSRETPSVDMAAIGITSASTDSKPDYTKQANESYEVKPEADHSVTAPDEPVLSGSENQTAEPLIEQPVTKEIAVPVVADQESRIVFHIIAGCFADEANAVRYVENLKSQGYSSSLMGQTRGGLHRVSIGVYPSYHSAFKALENVRRDVNPDAWLMQIN